MSIINPNEIFYKQVTFNERLIFYLLILLIYLSLFTSLPQLIAIFSGDPHGVTTAKGAWGLRLLREGLLFIILILLSFSLLLSRVKFGSVNSLILLLIIIILSIAEVIIAINNGLPMIIPIAGLRVFQYLPILLLGYYYSKIHPNILALMVKCLIGFIIIQSILGIFQVYYFPPLQGLTIFGSRASGSFGSANHYGVLMSTCFLLIYLSGKYRMLGNLCIIMAILSGSRAAIIAAFIVLLVPLFFKKNYLIKFIGVFMVPLGIIFSYFMASHSYISGRIGTSKLMDPRWEHWIDLINQNINGVGSLLFGWGLGLSSTGLGSAFGNNAFAGQFISDNQFISILSGFGIFGLLFFIIMLLYTLINKYNTNKALFVAFITFLCIPMNVLENFPQNLLLFFIWGWLLSEKNIKPLIIQNSKIV